MTNNNQTYSGDHYVMYKNIKPLCCTCPSLGNSTANFVSIAQESLQSSYMEDGCRKYITRRAFPLSQGNLSPIVKYAYDHS